MSSVSAPHIVVLGAGSVGRRHLRNLAALGARVSAMDPRADRLDEAAAEVPLLGRHRTTDEALADGHVDGVVIASPPSFHVDQSIAFLERGVPVLLEKPVSPDLASAERLRRSAAEAKAPLLLGYTYRWWPPLRDVKQLLEQGVIGRPLHARFVMSAHLADWHPWERYQDFFMASAEQGGGALLDESHFTDLMLWFFGMPSSVSARVEKLSQLEIETDDNVDAIVAYDSGLRAAIHLDLFGRPHEKYISITGDEGTIYWSFDPNRVRVGREAGQVWEDRSYTYERNDMFVDTAREFLEVVRTGAKPSCTIEDGVDVLRVVEAMRLSSETGGTVKLEGSHSRR